MPLGCWQAAVLPVRHDMSDAWQVSKGPKESGIGERETAVRMH